MYELMIIEEDARRFVKEAIEIDDELTRREEQEQDVTEAAQQLVEKMALINSIANVNGKGRSDLTDLQILISAQ